MKRRYEIVIWDDASHAGGPSEPKEIELLVRCRHVGWFIKEDKDHLCLGMEIFPNRGTFREIWTIPKVNIRFRQTCWFKEPKCYTTL